MACMFRELAQLENAKLVPNDSEPSGAKRPKDTQLDCSALELMGLARHTPLRDGLAAVVEHWRKNLLASESENDATDDKRAAPETKEGGDATN